MEQRVENSHVENMAGRDIHINIFNQNKPFPRNQYVHEILTVRKLCKQFEIVINTHAEKSYGSHFFKEMPEKELTEMYHFALHLREVWDSKQRPRLISWISEFFKKKK